MEKRDWPDGGEALAEALKEAIDDLDQKVTKVRHDLNVVLSWRIGDTNFGAVGDRLTGMDAKLENGLKDLRGLIAKAEAMKIANPTALERIRDFALSKQRENAKADGERAA